VTTASFETTEFRRSFTQETDELLRRRMIWFISVWGGINFILLVFTIIMLIQGVDLTNMLTDNWQRAFFILTSAVWFAAYLSSLLVVLGRKVSTKNVVHISMGLIMLDGAMGIGTRVMDIPVGPTFLTFIIAHFVACCIFPWTIRQAVIPILAIAGVSAFSHFVIEGNQLLPSIAYSLFILFAIPGVIITAIKHSQRVQRATNKFLSQRYGMLRQELAYARQVHEALFPAPHITGNIRYAYQYEPMRQIGGDYLYTKIHEITDYKGEVLSVVIIDVTGHGIPAALTVNRLHGEIDICFAENPDISPGELLEKLNKYVHLTLAKHSIYATAVCLRVNHDREVIEYASGGHPPAFIRGVDGSLRDIDPTTFVLGACADEDFESGQVEVEFMPGDSLIVYTDGAIEARSLEGKMLQIDGLRKILAGPAMPGVQNGGQGQWAERILNEVTAYRSGLPPEDDTLAIEIYRPISIDDRNAFDKDPVENKQDPIPEPV
jgi:serine phosphatase RsbU (regulator of sigma subunit)